MRKETSNQFTEGLVSDLNPINTPNTILTDCVNGTLITYNGNEYCLQNDTGNYELKNCRLDPNYIPVGIKEYGDILYIVSYNPITEKVQIGTYPSPLTYESSENDPGDRIIDSAIKELSKNIDENNEIKYSDLTKILDGVIFNEERFKLNPGDQYMLTSDGDWSYNLETINYKILNDESYYQDVTDLIKVNKGDYEYVPWTTPGFLAINSTLADIKIHGLNIKYFYLEEDPDGNKYFKFSFTTQLNVEDKNLKNTIDQWKKRCSNSNEKSPDIAFNFVVKEKYNKGGDSVENELINKSINFFETTTYSDKSVVSSNYNYSEWYDQYIYLWKTIYGEHEIDDFERTIIVDITPKFKDKNDIWIVFDNLTQVLEFDLTQADNGTYVIGDELFQFKVDSEKQQETIVFNTKSPLITNGSPPILYYRLYGFFTKKCSDWTAFKRNGYDARLGFENKVEYIIGLNSEYIGVEDAGYIEFGILKGENYSSLGKRIIVTSEYLDEFWNNGNYPIFDKDLTLNDWVQKYFDAFTFTCDIENASTLNTCDEKSTDTKRFYSGEEGCSFFSENNDLKDHCYYNGYKYEVAPVLTPPDIEGNLWTGKITTNFNFSNYTGTYSTALDNYLYCVDKLQCKFHKYNEAVDYYEDVKFEPLKEKMDELLIRVNYEQVEIQCKLDNDVWRTWTLGPDDNNYFFGQMDSLEKYIYNKGMYERVTTKSQDTIIGSADNNLGNDDNIGNMQPGHTPESGNNTINWYSEPDILDVNTPCRLLKITLDLNSNSECARIGVIKPASKEAGPYDMDTSITPYEFLESKEKMTFYFLMVYGDDLKLVDGGKRYAGGYILIPFDDPFTEAKYKNLCDKLIQVTSENKKISKTKGNVYKLEHTVSNDAIYNTVKCHIGYIFTKLNVDFLKDFDVTHTEIFKKKDDSNFPFNRIDLDFNIRSSLEYNVDLNCKPITHDFNKEIEQINKLNNNAEKFYTELQNNNYLTFSDITKDQYICKDDKLKNDPLKDQLTKPLDREYDDSGYIKGRGGSDNTYPDRITLTSGKKSWMCARVRNENEKINAGGKKRNFVVFGSVWADNEDYKIGEDWYN